MQCMANWTQRETCFVLHVTDGRYSMEWHAQLPTHSLRSARCPCRSCVPANERTSFPGVPLQKHDCWIAFEPVCRRCFLDARLALLSLEPYTKTTCTYVAMLPISFRCYDFALGSSERHKRMWREFHIATLIKVPVCEHTLKRLNDGNGGKSASCYLTFFAGNYLNNAFYRFAFFISNFL
jgi:hypothetical protein